MRPPMEFESGPDVRIIDGGTVFLFLLLTTEARAWVEAHVSADRQMLGTGLAVEPRYGAALAAGMADNGLVIEHDRSSRADPPRLGDDLSVADDDEVVEAVITPPRQTPASDQYDLGWLFTCWAWESGYRDWNPAVRALARTLRGLERTGLIERRTIRRSDKPTHHGFALTDEGRQAVAVLSGHWIEEDRR
jgi:hypothetical protein